MKKARDSQFHMSDIRLSIITPCRDAEQFIGACIENIIYQHCPEVEHIIMDGASRDSTPKILERKAAKLPRLRWVSEPDNGQSQAMNKGIEMARGEIIGFLNVDDIYQPGALRRVLQIFSEVEEPALVVANCDLVLRSGRVVRHSRPKGLSFESMLAGEVLPPLNPSSYFYHKSLHEICGLFEEDEHNFMDMKMLARLTRHANIHYFDEHWGSFRLHSKSKTNQRWIKGDILSTIDELFVEHLNSLPKAISQPIVDRRARAGK